MRKLASVRVITRIAPIPDADRIEVAQVDNWNVVVNKGVHYVGEKVIYCEIDSFLPIRPEFEFLRKSSYRKLADETEGFRLRTVKLRGQISQGLILPYSVLKGEYEIGEDVSEVLGIVKYEPPIPAELAGQVKGLFPAFIQKTDEERIQNLTENYEEYRKFKFFASEKVDGTSGTFYIYDGEFGVCSRNLELLRTEGNTYWRLVDAYRLDEKLRQLGRNLAIQGEVVGEGIQKNKYKLKGQKLLVYNIFDIDKYEYLPKNEMVEITKSLELDVVPTIFEEFELPQTIEEILKIAEDKSRLNPETEREGLVWVSINSPTRISFKTISNKFLLKWDE
jgi:RNA ligase (TIGR02306 family)